jgi:hypothetical protein
MKRFKIVVTMLMGIAFMFIFVSSAMGVVSMTVTSNAETFYHRFLVADLGILNVGGTKGKANVIFTVAFGTDSSTDVHHVDISVTKNSDTILSGATDSLPHNTDFSGETFNNSNITDADALGGSFDISGQGFTTQDQVLATGALPGGSIVITLQLVNDSTGSNVGGPQVVPITVRPPFLQPTFPVDRSATRAELNFRWVTNLNLNLRKRMELHIYRDPGGAQEVLEGGRLPALNLPASFFDGSGIAPFLVDGERYFWQVWGFAVTSHGDELVKGPRTEFIYYEELSQVILLGLSNADKAAIKDAILALLEQVVNRRAARSIQNYEIDRVVLDGTPIASPEAIPVIESIIDGDSKPISIYFR